MNATKGWFIDELQYQLSVPESTKGKGPGPSERPLGSSVQAETLSYFQRKKSNRRQTHNTADSSELTEHRLLSSGNFPCCVAFRNLHAETATFFFFFLKVLLNNKPQAKCGHGVHACAHGATFLLPDDPSAAGDVPRAAFRMCAGPLQVLIHRTAGDGAATMVKKARPHVLTLWVTCLRGNVDMLVSYLRTFLSLATRPLRVLSVGGVTFQCVAEKHFFF